jgi:hypothetical protein
MSAPRMALESLPPSLRAQAAAQLSGQRKTLSPQGDATAAGTASGAVKGTGKRAASASTGAAQTGGPASAGGRSLEERRLETRDSLARAEIRIAEFSRYVDKTLRIGEFAPIKARRKSGLLRHPNRTEMEFRVWFSTHHGSGDGLEYETLTFRLPGGSRYTPDFICWRLNGGIACFEVKGSYKLGSHGRALTAFREARAAFPSVKFRWFEKSGGGFVEKYEE